MKQSIGNILTKQSFWAEHFHDVRHWVVEERHSHGISSWHLARGVRQQGAVLEGPHCVHPGLARAVDETAVYPAGHLVELDM